MKRLCSCDKFAIVWRTATTPKEFREKIVRGLPLGSPLLLWGRGHHDRGQCSCIPNVDVVRAIGCKLDYVVGVVHVSLAARNRTGDGAGSVPKVVHRCAVRE